MKFKCTLKVVPKSDPSTDAEPFEVVISEEEARSLKAGTWRDTVKLFEPYLPEDKFMVAYEKLEALHDQ